MKYIIYSDIDGTIYSFDKKIHKQTFKDIKFAQSKNIEIVLCTGNPYLDNVETLAKKLEVRYCITSNGAAIFDTIANKFIYKSTICQQKAQKILDFANENKIAAGWWDEQKMYFNKWTPKATINRCSKVMTEEKRYKVNCPDIKNNIFKIEFYGESKEIDLIIEFMKNFGLQKARISPFHVEVTNEGISKGTGIKWLTEKLNSSLAKTMVIGDSSNDIPMFEVVNHSYAMANAGQHVKTKAKHHTSSVEQNGLGEAIIDFMYREKLDS